MQANQNQPNRKQDFYGYGVTFLALAAAANASKSFQIDTDSDFVLQKLTLVSDIAGAAITHGTLPVPLVTIQLTDGGSSRNMFSEAVPIGAIFGHGAEPFILPTPRFFTGGSTVTIALSNYSAATAYNIRLVFSGLKIFKFQ